MSDTVFPYDDEVRDPYDADDTKNPHEGGADSASAEDSSNDVESREAGEEDDQGDDDPPVTRRLGRPRKNPE